MAKTSSKNSIVEREILKIERISKPMRKLIISIKGGGKSEICEFNYLLPNDFNFLWGFLAEGDTIQVFCEASIIKQIYVPVKKSYYNVLTVKHDKKEVLSFLLKSEKGEQRELEVKKEAENKFGLSNAIYEKIPFDEIVKFSKENDVIGICEIGSRIACVKFY